MIIINIELKPQNRIQEFFHKAHDNCEDMLFFIIQHLPEHFISDALMNWIEKYINKRTRELQQQIIRQRWQQTYLEKAVKEIRSHHDKAKAPQED